MLISKPIKCKCNVKKCKNVNVKKKDRLNTYQCKNNSKCKCKKNKIDLIHINDKLNDNDSKNMRLLVRGKYDRVEAFRKDFI